MARKSLYGREKVAEFLTANARKLCGDRDVFVMPTDDGPEYVLYRPMHNPVRFRAWELTAVIRGRRDANA